MAIALQQVTSCDWLSFSVILLLDDAERRAEPVLHQPSGYILKDFAGTNIYKRRAILFTQQGDKVLTLLYMPYSKVINPASMFVEVANKYLYTGFEFVLDLLKEVHDYYFQSLSRFDIATDFSPSPYQMSVIDMLQSGKAYVQGKREGSMFHNYTREGDSAVLRTPKQMNWGSPTSTVKFKLYNKTLEITEVDPNGRKWINKPYIIDCWRCNGLFLDRDIWRLECSITTCSQQSWRGERLDYSTTAIENYTALFYDLVSTRFVIRKNEGHANKRYDKILPFLIMPDRQPYRLRKVEPKSAQLHTVHASTLRNLIKELDKPEVQCNRAMTDTLLATTRSVIQLAKLDGYFQRCMGMEFENWVEEYNKKLPYR